MSWTQELYKVYEQQCGIEHNDGNVLLPVSHSTANAQIEVTLRQDGSFVSARALSKDENKKIIIPVSAASGKRSGKNPPPHPLTDKLFYLAGDSKRFTIFKMEKGEKIYIDSNKYDIPHNDYLKQLKQWNESDYSHPALTAIYSYLEKGTLLTDLLEEHIIQLTNEELDEKNLSQFVCFYIQYDDFYAECRTWLDNSLYDCYVQFALSQQAEAPTDLCYATGKQLPIMKNTEHSKSIISFCANAKIISANDTDGFTYRGRFSNASEALSLSYDFSQKMHNALRWLIQRQSIQFGLQSALTIIAWTSSLTPLPNIANAALSPDDDDFFEEKVIPDTEPLYRDLLRNYILGSKAFDVSSKVMLMGLDATTKTTGRLSIVLYEELEHSRLLEQLVAWHAETAALRFYAKKKVTCPNSFSVREIINCAYGTEIGKEFVAKPEIIKDNVLRLLPCITQGRRIPADIVQNLVKKASNPLAYEQGYNHRTVLEAACGMIRKQNIEQKKGVTSMAFDPNETDRSYLFGCLLAVVDWAERETYEEKDKYERITNAKRYWSRFTHRPAETWAFLYGDKLIPYLNALQKKKYTSYRKFNEMVNEITAKFQMDEFANDAPLSPAYLLGYHHYNAEIYKKSENDKKNEEV